MTKKTEENYFADLAKISVKEQSEKKGKFTYLSWAWAVDVLRKHKPTATWEVIRFDGLPFLETSCGFFVEVSVTVDGITLSQLHPILDNYNKPITKPNSFQINTSLQRALVKAIALHGLGLYIYAGEDLPEMDEEEKTPQEKADEGDFTDWYETKEGKEWTLKTCSKFADELKLIDKPEDFDKFRTKNKVDLTRLEKSANSDFVKLFEGNKIIELKFSGLKTLLELADLAGLDNFGESYKKELNYLAKFSPSLLKKLVDCKAILKKDLEAINKAESELNPPA